MLSTARIDLRLWRDDDDERIAAIQTPAFMRWLQDADMPVRRTGSMTERMQAMQAEHGFCFWIAERRSDGALLGYCGLKRVDAVDTSLLDAFEIGWGIDEAHQGQGYATEAARAALNHAFCVHHAPFVVAFTVAGNGASWRVMEKLGMERRADLDFHDSHYSAALNPTIVYRIERTPPKAVS